MSIKKILPQNCELIISKYEMFITNGIRPITREFELTLPNLHNQFKLINFEDFYNNVIGGKAVRNDKVERMSSFPFAAVYYRNLFKNENDIQIITPEDMCNIYKNKYCTIKENNILSIPEKYTLYAPFDFEEKYIFARICRAYNSFNRELELLLQLFKITNDDFKIYYSLQDDFYLGADICIEYNNNLYALVTYANTSNSRKFRGIKEKYRHDYKGVYLIDIKANLDINTVRYGDVMVYGPETAKNVIDSILGQSSDFDIINVEDVLQK